MPAASAAAEQASPAAAAVPAGGAAGDGAGVVAAPPRGSPVGSAGVAAPAASPSRRRRSLVGARVLVLVLVARHVAVVLPGGESAADRSGSHPVPHRQRVPPVAARVGVAEQVLLFARFAWVCRGEDKR